MKYSFHKLKFALCYCQCKNIYNKFIYLLAKTTTIFTILKITFNFKFLILDLSYRSLKVWLMQQCRFFFFFHQVYHMLQERTQFGMGRDNRVRGTWGMWSSWNECSRSCGTGVQSQSRECIPLRWVRVH